MCKDNANGKNAIINVLINKYMKITFNENVNSSEN